MCFSATASFVSAGALTPLGLLSVRLASGHNPSREMPLALLPVLFASQQALEGLVWLGLEAPAPWATLRPAALAYLGFAFALWPIWIPWSALRLAAHRAGRWLQRLYRVLMGLGVLVAGALWIPLLLNPALINPIVRHGSIDYQVQGSWAERPDHWAVTLLYLLIIGLPLLLHPCWRLRWLGVALMLAFVLAQLAFLHAFSSVWCFFSALLSALVLWILLGEQPATLRRV